MSLKWDILWFILNLTRPATLNHMFMENVYDSVQFCELLDFLTVKILLQARFRFALHWMTENLHNNMPYKPYPYKGLVLDFIDTSRIDAWFCFYFQYATPIPEVQFCTRVNGKQQGQM